MLANAALVHAHCRGDNCACGHTGYGPHPYLRAGLTVTLIEIKSSKTTISTIKQREKIKQLDKM